MADALQPRSVCSGGDDEKLTQLLCAIALRPHEYLLRRWNWKSALFSASIRAPIFFLATIHRGWKAIGIAVAVEAVVGALASGVYGALAQALRRARPAWAVNLILGLILPVLLQVADYGAHYASGMRRMMISMIASGSFAAISSLFSLYIMRRGTMLVHGEGTSFAGDMTRIPVLIAGFLLAGPRWLAAQLRLLTASAGGNIAP